MQYESYERKIAKIASFLKWIFKHRIVILLCISIILAATASLLAAKGLIVEENECPDTLVYGDTFSYSAKDFLSDTYYEYSANDGKTWSEKQPTRPGEYLVRAAARATFGTRYSEPQSFTLLPKEITVSIASTPLCHEVM